VASCLCGACEITTKGQPKWCIACHCSECRRALSAAYAEMVIFPAENLEVTKGAGNLVSYSTGTTERFSCKICSSKLYARRRGQMAIFTNMFTTPNHGLNGKISERFRPCTHSYYASGVVNVLDGRPKFRTRPKCQEGGCGELMDENFHRPDAKPGKPVYVFATKAQIGQAVAKRIVELSAAAIKARGVFTVAFSGGSLPAIVCAGLLEAGDDLDYLKWQVFFSDERCVPLDHKDSNFNAVNNKLLSKVFISKANVHAIDPKLVDPAEAAAAYQADIEATFGTAEPKFDLLLLGMGPDGHTCSLFPGHALLNEKELLVASISDSPKPPSDRITLTYKAINAARHSFFVCTGDSKKENLHAILDTPDSGLPASLVASERVEWYVDHLAAELCDFE